MLFHNFLDITLAFSMPLYQVKEDNGLVQPVLHLSRAVHCCSTISVRVNIKDKTAESW